MENFSNKKIFLFFFKKVFYLSFLFYTDGKSAFQEKRMEGRVKRIMEQK